MTEHCLTASSVIQCVLPKPQWQQSSFSHWLTALSNEWWPLYLCFSQSKDDCCLMLGLLSQICQVFWSDYSTCFLPFPRWKFSHHLQSISTPSHPQNFIKHLSFIKGASLFINGKIFDVMNSGNFHVEYLTLVNKFNVTWFTRKHALFYFFFLLTQTIALYIAFQNGLVCGVPFVVLYEVMLVTQNVHVLRLWSLIPLLAYLIDDDDDDGCNFRLLQKK